MAVINEVFARKFVPNANPIGQHFGPTAGKHAGLYEIVGVAADVRYFPSTDHAVGPMYFVPEAQATTFDDRELESRERWSHYRAWRTLIRAHQARKEPGDALQACRELEKQLPTFENKCLLAEHLLDNKLKKEAIELLDQALEDHHYAPWGTRFRNWRAVAYRSLACCPRHL